MKIKRLSESHIVELEDGSTWRIFPGDLYLTLNWHPETELTLVPALHEIGSHILISGDDSRRVQVLPAAEQWPLMDIRKLLGDG